MNSTVAHTLDDLIDTYDLHSTVPVDLSPLEALFVPEHRDLSPLGLVGTAILPPGEITPANFARVILDTGLSPYDARLVYAHEVGHCLFRHEGGLQVAGMDAWFSDRFERDAWKVAARLLVPIESVGEYQELTVIAAACNVPEELVELACK